MSGGNGEEPEIPMSATCREKCTFELIEVEKAEDYIIDDERLCTFIDDDECRATFVYGYHNATGRLQVWVQTTKECPVVVDIMGKFINDVTKLYILAYRSMCKFSFFHSP